VTATNFNFACGTSPQISYLDSPSVPSTDLFARPAVIFVAVTIMAIVSYYVIPEENWLARRSIQRVLDIVEGKDVEDVVTKRESNDEGAAEKEKTA
jgi:hypothetical protein